MEHITTQEILAYVADTLSKEEVFRLEAHISGCDQCADRVDDVIFIRDHFDALWDAWTGEKHARAIFQAHVVESIARAEIPAGLRKRVAGWAQTITQHTRAALGIVMDAPQKAARVLQEGMAAICAPGATLAFAPALQPVRTTGDRLPAGIVVEAQGPPWVEVTVEPSAGKVTLRAREMPPPWPLTMLVPKGKGKALIGEFEQPEETDFLLAEFTGVADGEYILLLEESHPDEG